MAKPIYAKDLVEEFLIYASKREYDFAYFTQMKVYFECLLDKLPSCNLAIKGECESLAMAAESLIRDKEIKNIYPQLKATKVDRGKYYNSFVDFVNNPYGQYCGKTKLHSIQPVMNDLERKLDYVKNYKEYQKRKLEQKEIADIYYVDAKTIRNDNREIRGGYLNAFGQTIDIEYDSDSKTIFSTPIPLFTVQNMTQVVAMLNGLKIMSEDPRYQLYAEATAISIWKQLTTSVKDRIQNELVDILHLDAEWYADLDRRALERRRDYYTERRMGEDSNDVLLYLKNGLDVDITYAVGECFRTMQKVRIIDANENGCVITGDISISYENIVSIKENGN